MISTRPSENVQTRDQSYLTIFNKNTQLHAFGHFGLFVCLGVLLFVCFHFMAHSFSFCLYYSNCTDTMKESLASALRHSTRQAQFTYDKRNKSQKTQQALSFARFCAESEAGPSNVNVQEPEANAAKQFEVGDFVAVVQEGSTVAKPKILLGRITHYMTSAGHNQVILLRYESIGSCQYKLDLSTGRWIEPESNLFAVKVKFSNKADIYKLITSARSIHKSKHCDR